MLFYVLRNNKSGFIFSLFLNFFCQNQGFCSHKKSAVIPESKELVLRSMVFAGIKFNEKQYVMTIKTERIRLKVERKHPGIQSQSS